MLSIRLSRIGKKKQPSYRLIVIDKARDPFAKYLEILGSYNPRTKKAEIKADRVKYWLSCGAWATPTIHNLLVSQNIITDKKVRASQSRPGKKKRATIAAKKKAEIDAAKVETATVSTAVEAEKVEPAAIAAKVENEE